MRLFRVASASAVFLVALLAYGGQPAGSSSPPGSPNPGKPADAADDAMGMFRFTPLWWPVPGPSHAETRVPVPSPAYAAIWQPECQKELGLSAAQQKALLAIYVKATAGAKHHAEQFKNLSPEDQKAQAKVWALRRQRFDDDLRTQIETLLTPRQLQMLKDLYLPACAVIFLYEYAKLRQQIGFSPEQEDRLRRVARERLAGFQQISLALNEKAWTLLTPQQQAKLPEVVKHQGPTSATQAIAWELGFDFENCVDSYPMLSEAPVRRRLGLSAEQEKKVQAVMAGSAARLKSRLRGVQTDDSKQVEAILTPQQLAALNTINFHRQVVLALGYPEKRKTVGVTDQQWAEIQRLIKDNREPMYRIDQEMLGRAEKIFTPRQREQLRGEVDRRVH